MEHPVPAIIAELEMIKPFHFNNFSATDTDQSLVRAVDPKRNIQTERPDFRNLSISLSHKIPPFALCPSSQVYSSSHVSDHPDMKS
jgi:hypothetical protein